MKILGQAISLFAMLAIILSFQCKSNKKLAVVMGAGALMFAVSYFMLGQASAAVFNIITGLVSVLCLKEEFKTKPVFAFFTALYVVVTAFTYSGLWSLVLMMAQIVGAYSIMFGSGTFIRNARFFFVSPIWLINNTVVCFTIGGTACEIITMVSVVVSFIRYGRTGFED